VHTRQAKGVGQIRLGQQQIELVIQELANRAQALQQFTQEIGRSLKTRAHASIGDPLAGLRRAE